MKNKIAIIIFLFIGIFSLIYLFTNLMVPHSIYASINALFGAFGGTLFLTIAILRNNEFNKPLSKIIKNRILFVSLIFVLSIWVAVLYFNTLEDKHRIPVIVGVSVGQIFLAIQLYRKNKAQ